MCEFISRVVIGSGSLGRELGSNIVRGSCVEVVAALGGVETSVDVGLAWDEFLGFEQELTPFTERARAARCARSEWFLTTVVSSRFRLYVWHAKAVSAATSDETPSTSFQRMRVASSSAVAHQ